MSFGGQSTVYQLHIERLAGLSAGLDCANLRPSSSLPHRRFPISRYVNPRPRRIFAFASLGRLRM